MFSVITTIYNKKTTYPIKSFYTSINSSYVPWSRTVPRYGAQHLKPIIVTCKSINQNASVL